MRMDEANKLKCGVYYLHWQGGGGSQATVGILRDGSRWFAPCDWISKTPAGIACTNWNLVSRAELVVPIEDATKQAVVPGGPSAAG